LQEVEEKIEWIREQVQRLQDEEAKGEKAQKGPRETKVEEKMMMMMKKKKRAKEMYV
jgi:hypothetical protein